MNIVINKENLLEKEINFIQKKARAFIIDDFSNIIICSYADLLMFPGGKVDINESYEESIIREIHEETGMMLDKTSIKEEFEATTYLKNFSSKHSQKLVNKKIITKYFLVRVNEIDLTNGKKLSENEKNENFNLKKIHLSEVLDFFQNHKSTNKRYELFFKEENIEAINKLFHKYKLIDLHTHSTFSDGKLNPDDLFKLAKNSDIGTLSITDHNSVNAIFYSLENKLENKYNIKLIHGCELSAKYKNKELHILGYNIDINNLELKAAIDKIRISSIYYLSLMFNYLNTIYNINFSYDEVIDTIRKDKSLNRVDIAKLLIKYNYATSISDACVKYLNHIKTLIGDHTKGLDYKEIIRIIKKANGTAVLAHPGSYNLNHEEFKTLLSEMKTLGLDGLEVFSFKHTSEDIKYYYDIAKDFDLIITAGSDYHGNEHNNSSELGFGTNNNAYNRFLAKDITN